MTMRACACVVLSSLLLCFCVSSYGRDPGKKGEVFFLARPDAVVVSNNAEQALRFSLGAEGRSMQEHQLGPREARQFSQDGAQTYYIELMTDGKPPIRYKLTGSRRYQLYWNGPRQSWDVTELRAQ